MRVIRFLTLAVTAAGAVALGCGSMGSARGEMAAGGAMPHSHDHGMGMMGSGMCPMQVPGTTVTAADVEGGVALSFTTSTGEVAELRERVRRMAEMDGDHHAGAGMMPAATASVEEIAGGARLVLRPQDPAQLDAFREHVRSHAGAMARGECPMMHAPPSP